MNTSATEMAEVPPGVVTVTSTTPVPAGEVAMRVVELVTMTDAAGVAPKKTAVVRW